MAALEERITGDFDEILARLEQGILEGSLSATLEGSSDFRSGDARCSVRVFERYSWSGGKIG